MSYVCGRVVRRSEGVGFGRQELLEPEADSEDAGLGVELAGTVQGSHAGEQAVAAVAGGEAPPGRIGNRAARMPLSGQEGVGEGLLASVLTHLRKVLSHTLAVCFCRQAGLSPLRFSELLTY